MKWVTVEINGEHKCGLLQDNQIRLMPDGPLSQHLGNLKTASMSAGQGGSITLSDAKFCAPIPKPGKILAIGANYPAHAKESVSFANDDKPRVQKWFNKQVTSINAPFGEVCLPAVSEQLDYEAELVVVIGKTGRHVPVERAMELVAGFSVGCDYSVRDWQRASPTMIMGKGFDTHAPVGPWMVTPEDIDDLDALEVTGYVNGELRQTGHIGDMTFNICEQIAHLTAAFTLEPGDLIFTGTPAGVGAGHKPPKWLNVGDKVRVEIPGLGAIENMIVAEPSSTRIEG